MKKRICLMVILLAVMLCTVAALAAEGWECPLCGRINTDEFCENDGTAKADAVWVCPLCGRENDRVFCPKDGKAKPSHVTGTLRADENTKTYEEGYGTMPVFGNAAYQRKDIKKIVFGNNVYTRNNTAWDVSETWDGAVFAWVDDDMTLHIAPWTGGVVALPQNCRRLFRGYENAVSIEFGSNIRTVGVTDMNGMFWECSRLQTLDVSGFDTSSVTDMNFMFCGCTALGTLDLTGFDMTNVSQSLGMTKGVQNVIR